MTVIIYKYREWDRGNEKEEWIGAATGICRRDNRDRQVEKLKLSLTVPNMIKLLHAGIL